MQRSESDLKINTKEQLRFIKNSCSLFDRAKCNQIEALRISTALNILLSPRKYKGLLQELNFTGKILSTIPEVIKIPLDRLNVIKCLDVDEMEDYIQRGVSNDNFNLYLITSSSDWYIYAKNKEGKNIKSKVGDLGKLISPGRPLEPFLGKWIQSLYKEEIEDGFSDEGKEIIIFQIAYIMGFNNYCPSLFIPMIEGKGPILSKYEIARYLCVDDWLDEIIFCIQGQDSRKRKILTRKMLIETARDKDGGAHLDKTLQNVSEYVLSKEGVVLGEYNGKQLTTKNYHFYMLRQLAFEILHSPDIVGFLNN